MNIPGSVVVHVGEEFLIVLVLIVPLKIRVVSEIFKNKKKNQK